MRKIVFYAVMLGLILWPAILWQLVYWLAKGIFALNEQFNYLLDDFAAWKDRQP